jgi:putative ABC transport system permease protein
VLIAVRRLLREPSFAATAIGTLALGMAAATALFAVVYGTLLRPLPYRDAADIYTVRTTMTDGRFTIGLLASEEMTNLRKSTDAIVASALTVQRVDTIVADAQSTQVTAVGVSEGFFDLFGVPMAAGRPFTPDDHQATDRTLRSVVLAYHTWRTMFGGDGQVIGRTIRLASGPVRVVGVAAADFDQPHDADLWIAEHYAEAVGHTFDAYVRFRPGTSPTIVSGAMKPFWEALAVKYPDMERNRVFVLRPLLQTIVGDLGPTVVIAFAATGLLLLLAIVNVGNLLLARGAARARELAVQAALGATRWHLLRHLLAESVVISAAAAAVALPLASMAVSGIAAVGGSTFPRADGLRFDPIVFVFAAGVMVVAGVLVGVLPAVTAGRTRLSVLVNESGRGAMQGRVTRRLLGAMIAAEVALAVALVAGAGRLLLSLEQLTAIDPGFAANGRLAVDVLLPPQPYRNPDQRQAWTQQVEERLRAIGATHVGIASSLPLRHEWDSTAFIDIEGRPTDPQNRPNARVRFVSPDLFAALGLRLAAGRAFTEADREARAPVAVVNEAWARKFLPGLDPLREHLALPWFGRMVNKRYVIDPTSIIGVVRDVRYTSLARESEPVVYLCDSAGLLLRQSLVVTAADGHPERLVPQIRAALNEIDPNVPASAELMADAVAQSLVWSRLGLLLMGTFGTAALLLASVGVFGVIAYVVSQRLTEMAVRLALGASSGQVFRMVLRQGGWLAIQGAAGGVLLAWWTGQLVGRYVYHVSAADPLVLAGSAAIVLAVSLVATLPSARRAAAVGPSRVLRS